MVCTYMGYCTNGVDEFLEYCFHPIAHILPATDTFMVNMGRNVKLEDFNICTNHHCLTFSTKKLRITKND